MTTTVEILEHARATIRQGWTQGASAVGSTGLPTEPWDPSACKWCLTGSLMKSIHQITGVDTFWFYAEAYVGNPPSEIAWYDMVCTQIEDLVEANPAD